MVFSPTIQHLALRQRSLIDLDAVAEQLTAISVIKALFVIGPLFFGLAFLAPLTAQLIERFGWAAPFGLSSLQFGLALGEDLLRNSTDRNRISDEGHMGAVELYMMIALCIFAARRGRRDNAIFC
jgi:hypothetical protein